MRHGIPIWLVFTIALNLHQTCAAQNIDREAFRETDLLVDRLGAMRDSSLKSIVAGITPLCHDQVCIIRAIYKWTTKNIARDCEAGKHPERANTSASYVFVHREGTPKGYAVLIAEMCRMAGITCEVIDGMAKSDADDIGHVDNEANAHTWNVVNVKGRWYVLDAARGAGYCDGRQFQKQYKYADAWFLTNRKLFALCHYPADKRKQLLDTPLERSGFVAAPIIGPIASILGIIPAPGQRGLLRGRQDSSVKISFMVKSAYLMDRIRSVSIAVAGDTAEISFSKSADMLATIVPFPKEGKYPLTLLVNKELAFIFRAEASPRPVKHTSK
jgi:hypothetical protein